MLKFSNLFMNESISNLKSGSFNKAEHNPKSLTNAHKSTLKQIIF